MTRQSMNVLLQTLERDGFVIRPPDAALGRVQPTELTESGRRSLAQATVAVRGVERRMLAGLDEDERAAARHILRSMITSLRTAGAGQRPVDPRSS